MTLIAESGATKTDWALVTRECVKRTSTTGINFATMSPEAISTVISEATTALEAGNGIDTLAFYGAGLLEEPELLRNLFPGARIEACSDLLAAARALFGNSDGIAAILGTGSNSCLYEKGEIVRNIHCGGFILGDEGSGACLGKRFLSDLIKEIVPSGIAEAFGEKYESDYASIVRNVYRSPTPSAYLGSIAPWILSQAGDPYIDGIIEDNIVSFFHRALSRYGRRDLPVGIAGGFGFACRDTVERVAAHEGVRIEKFLRSPMEGLIEYHK